MEDKRYLKLMKNCTKEEIINFFLSNGFGYFRKDINKKIDDYILEIQYERIMNKLEDKTVELEKAIGTSDFPVISNKINKLYVQLEKVRGKLYPERHDKKYNKENEMEKIKVLIYEPGKAPELTEIENTLESLRKIVKGHIENVRITHDLNLICNEEGKLLNLPPNIFVNGDIIAGPCIIAADDRANEDYGSLDEHQTNKALIGIAIQNTNDAYLMHCAKRIYYKDE